MLAICLFSRSFAVLSKLVLHLRNVGFFTRVLLLLLLVFKGYLMNIALYFLCLLSWKMICWITAWLLYMYLQFLPVPELLPFRLTQQFVNLMLPLKESGTLKNVMVHTLRALRNNHELLLNTMDVFIKEPSLDWQVSIDKLQVLLIRH